MINIVAGHRVEVLVGEIQLYGVPAPERSVLHALRQRDMLRRAVNDLL